MKRVDKLFARFCRTGSPPVLARVFDATAPELLRVARHLAPDAHRAEDLVQSTFLTAIEKRKRFDPSQPVLPWLLGILANEGRMLRRRDDRVARAGRVTVGVEGDPAARAADHEFDEALTRALCGLPDGQRRLLILHLHHGCTCKEIAELLGRPAGTVRSQVSRAMDGLRKLLPAGFAAGVVVSSAPAATLARIRARVLDGTGSSATTMGATAKVSALAVLAVALASTLVWRVAGVSRGAASHLSPVGSTPMSSRSDAGSARPSQTTVLDRVAPPGRWAIHGVVREGSAPVIGARVLARAVIESTRLQFAAVEADADGRYEIDLERWRESSPLDLGRMSFEITASSPEHPRSSVAVELLHEDPFAPMTLRQDIELQRATLLRGRVVDASNRPLADAEIDVEAGGATIGRTTTDSDGRFAVPLAVIGEHQVRAYHFRHGRATHRVEILQLDASIDVPDLVAAEGATVTGVVRFGDGSPVVGVRVWIESTDVPRSFQRGVSTDSNGRFECRVFDPVTHRVRLGTALSLGRPEWLIEPDADPLEIELDACVLRFRFLDETGRQIAPHYFSMFGTRSFADAAQLRSGELPVNGLHANGAGMTGASRRAILPHRTAWWVRCDLNGHVAERLIEVGDAVNELEVPIRLARARRTARLRIVAVDEHDCALSQLKLRLEQLRFGEPASQSEVEDSTSDFVFECAPGRFRAHIGPGGLFLRGFCFGETREVELFAGQETSITYRARLGGRVRVKLRTPDGQRRGLEGFEARVDGVVFDEPLEAVDEGWRRSNAPPTDTPLLFQELLTPGRHVVEVRAAHQPPVQVGVSVVAGQTVDAELWLSK